VDSTAFVAARGDEVGVLVLSEFVGAADELTEALVAPRMWTDSPPS
jgi:trehalose-6-phosphate synthase